MGGEQLYEDYCKAVGGIIILPSWDALEHDRQASWNNLGRKCEEKRVYCYDFCTVCAGQEDVEEEEEEEEYDDE
jgi:hypothetical protein